MSDTEAKEAVIARMRLEHERFKGSAPDAKTARAIEETARKVAESAGAVKNHEFRYRPKR